ncbi:hypothetical protein CspHIS471_0101350 [Cutaneotrichosporon sp. HIS471]|nr:hypothetical protein CspHIS471_0101350 [Cutaneotrichosporon sp. HIS471]
MAIRRASVSAFAPFGIAPPPPPPPQPPHPGPADYDVESGVGHGQAYAVQNDPIGYAVPESAMPPEIGIFGPTIMSPAEVPLSPLDLLQDLSYAGPARSASWPFLQDLAWPTEETESPQPYEG